MRFLSAFFLVLMLGSCAAPLVPDEASPPQAQEYRVVMLYDTWGEDWPGFDQLIARLEGVQWAQETEHGVFTIAYRGGGEALTKSLKALAAEAGATFESCQQVNRWDLGNRPFAYAFQVWQRREFPMRQFIASLLILATFFGAMPLAAAPFATPKYEPQLLWRGWCPEPMPVKASYTLKLEGLAGKDSIEAATKLLKAIDGVETVAIDAETNIATVTLKAGKTLSEDALKAAFKDSKYTFKEFALAE